LIEAAIVGLAPCEQIYRQTCTSVDPILLSTDDLVLLRKVDVAHEIGHGFDIDHNPADCDSIMAQFGWLPLPTAFDSLDLEQVRLHRKHF